MIMKQCSKCKQMKDESEFNKDRTSKDWLTYWCKSCQNEHDKQYHKEHQTEHLASTRKWHNENPEKLGKIHKKAIKKYHEGHKEECSARMKRWCEENPEKHKKIYKRTMAKRKRTLDWEPLYPNPFGVCEIIHWHHVNNEHVVAIPEDLHQLYCTNTERHRENLSYIVDQIYGGN